MKKRKKKQPSRKTARALFSRLPPELGAALEAYLSSLRLKPTRQSLIEVSIEEYLKSQGFWPPKEEE